MSWWALLALLWPLWLRRRPEEERPLWARRSLILLITLLTARYLIWRITNSLNLSTALSTGLSLGLLLTESWLLLTGLITIGLAWKRFPDRREEMDGVQHHWLAGRWRPQVDLYVPTCGEPLAVLERTLIGCLQQSYSHTAIWILDDSGRQEVHQLALQLGCHYVHRPERLHAKAGNLNNGLRHGQGELVAVLDADFIPQRDFLSRCIGFLTKPDVALVQTPQCFLNADPVMRNLGMEPWLLSDEESFYRWIQPVRDGWGAVVCAGTSFVARRSALDSVGGFAEGAISEDLVTGISLNAQGWRLIYLQEKLSAGLAAETMADFVRQRQRWAEGTLQSLGLRHGPLRNPHLTLAQRIAYLEGAVHWFNMLPRTVLLLMPLSYGLLHVLPVLMRWQDARDQLLPLWGTLLLSVGWLNRRSRGALISELTSWVLAVPLSLTVMQQSWRLLLGRASSGFRITPKHQRRDRGSCSASLVLPLLGLTLISLLNLQGLLMPAPGLALQEVDGRPIGLVWAGLNMVGLLIALRACWDPPVSDPAPWLELKCQAWLDDHNETPQPCMITAISESGVEVVMADSRSQDVKGHRLSWCEQVPALPVRLVKRRGNQLSLQWQPSTTDPKRQALIRWLYGRPGCWPDRQAQGEWKALLVLLSRILRPAPTPGPLQRSLMRQQLK
ncbi:MAG: glycosyltransferase family 2 protein [Synechococcus sp.]